MLKRLLLIQASIATTIFTNNLFAFAQDSNTENED